MEAGISPLCVNPVASSPTPRRSRHPVVPLSDSPPVVLARSLARAFERAYSVPLCMYLSVDCSKDDDDDEVETGAVEYRGRASQVCVSVPEIDGNELPALRTYSCEISV